MQLLGKCSSLSTQLSTKRIQVSYLTSSIPVVLVDPIYHIVIFYITNVHSVYFLCPTITTELLQLPNSIYHNYVCSFLFARGPLVYLKCVPNYRIAGNFRGVKYSLFPWASSL